MIGEYLRKVGGWFLIAIGVISAGFLGVEFGERTSPPILPEVSVIGKEFDEGGISAKPGFWFRDQGTLRDFIFRQGLKDSGSSQVDADDSELGGILFPETFLLKVVAEDGGMVEVEFIQPRKLAGERGWVRGSDLAVGLE
ncbi:MAG: hypothetical protein AAGA58_06955 [Verrucomicrobiota bacterium]